MQRQHAMNQNKSEVRNRPALLPHEWASHDKHDMEASSSSSQSSLREPTTLHLDEPGPQGLRGLYQVLLVCDWMPLSLQPRGCQDEQPCIQENSLLKDELSTSKSTILHLIHELNQAKNPTRIAAASHSSSKLQGEILTRWHNVTRHFACRYMSRNTKHMFWVRMQAVTSACCRVLYTCTFTGGLHLCPQLLIVQTPHQLTSGMQPEAVASTGQPADYWTLFYS